MSDIIIRSVWGTRVLTNVVLSLHHNCSRKYHKFTECMRLWEVYKITPSVLVYHQTHIGTTDVVNGGQQCKLNDCQVSLVNQCTPHPSGELICRALG
jgi:hypothetical protein